MNKFIAYNKNTKKLVDGVMLSSEGNLFIARSSDKFNSMVNKWYKKQGDLLGGDYAEIDYTDWWAIENVNIEWYSTNEEKELILKRLEHERI